MNRATFVVKTLALLLVVGSAWAQHSSNANAPVTGSGTPGQIPIWVDTKTLGASGISRDASGGIYVTTTASSGSGVAGIANAAAGDTLGVYGRSDSTGGAGVLGQATATTGVANGVYGATASPNGYGVQGYAPNIGVYGVSTSSGGTGLVGFGQATTGLNYGVIGVTNSTSGIGMWGNSSATSGVTAGVFGLVSSSTGTAGVFNNHAGGNILIGQSHAVGVFRVDGTGKGFFNGGAQTGGADFAESMAVSGSLKHYEPGDVLVIDRSAHRRLALAEKPYSILVAGIYSTKPGVLATPHFMSDPVLAEEIPLAIVGIVPCKVSAENGPITRDVFHTRVRDEGHRPRAHARCGGG
jgi:hypothetical protein